MTADEVEEYINQIAFSGANDFLEKYKNDANAIIGHFGLGFYSAFMVAKKVEIVTRSYKEDAKAIKWSCDGSPEFTLEDAERDDRGTDIILYIDDDCKEFLEESRIQGLLNKYCRFLPVPDKVRKMKKVWTEDGYILFWTAPKADTEMDKAVRYVVYRFGNKEKVNLDDPSHIVAITRNPFYKLPYETGKTKYRYVVTALDRLHNESKSVSKKLKL